MSDILREPAEADVAAVTRLVHAAHSKHDTAAPAHHLRALYARWGSLDRKAVH